MGRFASVLLACSLVATVCGFRVHQSKLASKENNQEQLTEKYQNGVVADLINVEEFETTFDAPNCEISGVARNGQPRKLRLGRQLGSGAQGVVYAGMENGEETCAVKLSKDLDVKELNNLKMIARNVRSQHMLTLEDGFEDVQKCCGKACVVTQLIRGKDMAHIMWDNGIRTMNDVKAGKARKGSVSYKLMKSLVLQALAAYKDTETAGLCNHDQHLRNMMYEEASERVVFIDFGYARLTNGAACPPPAWVFKPETSDMTSLQSFYALGFLLEDPEDQKAFNALCGRISKQQYRSSADALVGEAFASSAQDPQQPGAFFQRHMDDTIVQQLQQLKSTGSPHLGQPTAESPFQGKGGGNMVPSTVPVQNHIQTPVIMPTVVDNQAYQPDASCHSTCGATDLQEARNGEQIIKFGRAPLTNMPLMANECAKCHMRPDCNTGMHTSIGIISGLGSICCRKMHCSKHVNVAPVTHGVPAACQLFPGYTCKGCLYDSKCVTSTRDPVACSREHPNAVFCP